MFKIALLVFLVTPVFGGKILAPDEDNYLLVTVRKDTTYQEFVNLFNFYLKVRCFLRLYFEIGNFDD